VSSPPIPRDDPDRRILHHELHARPALALRAPESIVHLALRIAADEREREAAMLAELAHGMGLPPVDASSGFLFLESDALRVKWERHTEFTGLTLFRRRDASARSGSALDGFPADWLSRWPGATIVAAFADLVGGSPDDTPRLVDEYGDTPVVGARLGEGVATALTDFRLDADGFLRFVVVDHRMTARQAGRFVQRLLEIETYRMMALLAFPVAKEVGATLAAADAHLASIADRMAASRRSDEEGLLDELTSLAAEVERSEARSRFRFGAAAAYYQLVRRRIAELRETRLPGVQTFDEFLGRRLAPAMATCESVARRQHELSARVARASQLLRTRVEVALQRQNQSLLESMNRRVRLQLALQRTVEGFSIAAITYYVAGLVGYLARAAGHLGVAIDADLAAGASVPVTAVLLYFALRRMRRRSDVD
jgi:uncharacterized membrane-anchored protein